MRGLWGVADALIARGDWLSPPNGYAWLLPLASGAVAVLAPDRSGEPRLAVRRFWPPIWSTTPR